MIQDEYPNTTHAECEKNEEWIDAVQNILYRQAHPKWIIPETVEMILHITKEKFKQ